MASQSPETPDLASVLRILSGINSQNRQQQGQAENSTPASHLQPQHEQTQRCQTPAVASRPQPGPKAQPQNMVDPATIIEWSAGLRCVMKTVAKHDNVLSEIRRMIEIQHEHEEQWWQGRDALVEKQKARRAGQEKLDAVLRVVGGNVSTGKSNTSPEEMAKELETFDMKVYRAQFQMVREMTAKLRGLGVPFFGTRSDLVVPSNDNGEDAPKGNAKGPSIDELELVKLQRKMLVLLEDLCSD